MVKIPPPPPSRAIAPRHTTLTPADKLVRIYHPVWLGPSSYNHNGPRARFDHHVVAVPPVDDPAHGIYYAAPTLHDCVVEVFGDAGVISLAVHRVAMVSPSRTLRLLELRDGGAWDAGTVAAVAKDADRSITQAWARYVYDDPRYGYVDGIAFDNAHTDAPAYALFERAGTLDVDIDLPLSDPRLRGELGAIATELNLLLIP